MLKPLWLMLLPVVFVDWLMFLPFLCVADVITTILQHMKKFVLADVVAIFYIVVGVITTKADVVAYSLFGWLMLLPIFVW